MDENLASDSERIQRLLHRFNQSFGRQMMNSLTRDTVNLPQFNTMHVLAKMGEANMGELADRVGVTMGASTNIIDKLVRAGCATRRRDPRDRRMVKVRLTGKGVETVQNVTRQCTEFLIRALKNLDPEERRVFVDIYDKIVRLSEKEISDNPV